MSPEGDVRNVRLLGTSCFRWPLAFRTRRAQGYGYATPHRCRGHRTPLLRTARVPFEPLVDPYGFHTNRSSSTNARVTEFATLASGVDGVTADACILRPLGNGQPNLHRPSARARKVRGREVVVGSCALERAGLRPTRCSQRADAGICRHRAARSGAPRSVGNVLSERLSHSKRLNGSDLVVASHSTRPPTDAGPWDERRLAPTVFSFTSTRETTALSAVSIDRTFFGMRPTEDLGCQSRTRSACGVREAEEVLREHRRDELRIALREVRVNRPYRRPYRPKSIQRENR